MTFTVALVQVASPRSESVPARRARVDALVRAGVSEARGVELVVLPELWAAGYFSFDEYPRRAESLAGPTVRLAQAWARDLDCHVHLGSLLERTADGRLFNTAVLLGPDGDVLHTYRKIHVFGYRSREAELLTSGTTIDVADTPWGRLSATTCYDLRFPELWRRLVDAGARIVVTPAAWPAARLAHWRLFTSVRAVEEQIILIACNAVGEQGGEPRTGAGTGAGTAAAAETEAGTAAEAVRLGGHSRVVDPWGRVLAEAGDDEGVTLVEIDPEEVARVRAEFPVLADRRLGIATPPAPAPRWA
jgi:predicted amidohydrolase